MGLKTLFRRWGRAAPVVSAALLLSAAAGATGGDPAYDAADNAAGSNQPIVTEGVSRVELIAARTAIGESASAAGGATVTAGLWFRLDPGWKTYWRSPGDAGYPAEIDWSASENLGNAEVLWPAPKRYSAYGLDSIGYEHEVVLPLRLQVADPARPLSLDAVVSYLVCEEICIPQQQNVALVLPPGPAQATAAAHLIDRYRAAVPAVNNPKALRIAVSQMAGRGPNGEARLQVTARAAAAFETPDLFLEGPDKAWFSAPEAALRDGGRRAVFDLAAGGVDSFIGADLTATLVDGDRAWESRVMVDLSTAAGPGLAVILGLAFLGGLILNLMPCVLPVLSLKVLGVIDHGGGLSSRGRFLSAAAGILSSFLLLALGLAILQAGGQRVGWGVQFQQPVFLAAMAVVITLFACNLWGWFSVALPRPILDRLPARAEEDGLLGHFATGAFATLLATPCSAPFLGTAVGFALAGGTGDIFAVFIMLGLGFAAPYLTFAFLPAATRWLPKPGRWMTNLKYTLGGLLAGTALWLVTVIAAQSGAAAALAIGGLLAALAIGLALAASAAAGTQGPGKLQRSGRWLAGACGVAVIALSAGAGPGAADRTVISEDGETAGWRPFETAWIDAQVRNGQVVLVDVTADWCVTCQVNKRLVLDSAAISGLLQSGDILGVRADWTRPDPVIADYLAEYGRYGIPFNIVYGPGAPDGVVLPELLITGDVLAAIDRARGSLPAAIPGAIEAVGLDVQAGAERAK